MKIWRPNRTIRSFACALAALSALIAVDATAYASEQPVVQTAQPADNQLNARAVEKKKLWEQRIHLMDQLFPKSRGWDRVDQLPFALSGENADKQRSVLITMGLNLDGVGEVGGLRRDAKDYVGGVRRMDANGGLLYSGPAPDREGEVSIAWSTYPSGSPHPVPVMQIVRVKSGADPRFTGRDHGCCADTVEVFYRGDLNDPDGFEVVRSSTMLSIPDDALDVRFPLSLIRGCTVRFSTEIDDTLAPEGHGPAPAIGNVARKFNWISDAVSLMARFDKDGKAWVLIRTGVMDDAVATYSDPGGPPVDVGWIDATQIDKANNSAFWAWFEGVRRTRGPEPR